MRGLIEMATIIYTWAVWQLTALACVTDGMSVGYLDRSIESDLDFYKNENIAERMSTAFRVHAISYCMQVIDEKYYLTSMQTIVDFRDAGDLHYLS